MRTLEERIEDLEEEVSRLILIQVQYNDILNQAMIAAASSEKQKAISES